MALPVMALMVMMLYLRLMLMMVLDLRIFVVVNAFVDDLWVLGVCLWPLGRVDKIPLVSVCCCLRSDELEFLVGPGLAWVSFLSLPYLNTANESCERRHRAVP